MIWLLLFLHIVALGILGLAVFWILAWRRGRPVFHHFKSSSIGKAFVLNAIAGSLIIVIALVTKSVYDKFFEDEHRNAKNRGEDYDLSDSTDVISIIITLMTTFMASLIAYTALYVLFGFGGGMLTNTV